jgi:hypothetical protein
MCEMNPGLCARPKHAQRNPCSVADGAREISAGRRPLPIHAALRYDPRWPSGPGRAAARTAT